LNFVTLEEILLGDRSSKLRHHKHLNCSRLALEVQR
jgi:hypothetical protein